MTKELAFSSGDVSASANVPYQTLVSWDNAGILKPSLARRNGQRRYTMEDLVAATIAKAMLQIGMGYAVREAVRMVQKPNPEHLRNALIITAKSETPGFMCHYWFADVTDPGRAQEIDQFQKRGVANSASLEEIGLAVEHNIRSWQISRWLP